MTIEAAVTLAGSGAGERLADIVIVEQGAGVIGRHFVARDVVSVAGGFAACEDDTAGWLWEHPSSGTAEQRGQHAGVNHSRHARLLFRQTFPGSIARPRTATATRRSSDLVIGSMY